MITDVQQTAYGYYLLAKNLSDRKFKTVFDIDTHGRNAFLFSSQYFVVQRMDAVKLFHAFSMFEKHNTFVIASDYLRLVAVFLVTCAALFEQLTQIVLIELNIHISVFSVLQR